jgi:glutaredoxin
MLLTQAFGSVRNRVAQKPAICFWTGLKLVGPGTISALTPLNGKDTIMSDKPVKVFSLSTCSHCKSTKRLLDECTVKYEFVDVDLLDGDERKAILADVKKFNPRCSFPTVIIGDNVIVGYKEDKIREALGL